MIGRHQCNTTLGRGCNLRDTIAISLDELFTALEESFADLTDERAWAFVIPGHNNIAWIVMHVLDNLDEHAVGSQTGQRVTPFARRWELWDCRPDERPKPGDPFPGVADMLALTHRIRDAAVAAIDHATDADLTTPISGATPPGVTRSDYYMRTICHTHAHLRQLWLIRGALSLTDGHPRRWPQQHWE